jgi:hypothetical protein
VVKLFCFAATLALALSPAWTPVASTATAQEDKAGDPQQARRLFEEGVALAESQRWAEALSAFRRSAELVPRASTSFNIANALYRLDRPADALVELDRYGELPEVQRDYAALRREAALRALVEDAVAEVRLAITPSAAEVFVDGRLSTATGFERLIHLNPGTHSIRIAQDGYVATLRALHVGRGSREAFTIALRPRTPPSSGSLAVLPPTSSASEAAADDRKPFVKRPGFWVMIGAIVVVGVGAGVAVALTRKDDAPQCGTTGNCATTQGLTVAAF